MGELSKQRVVRLVVTDFREKYFSYSLEVNDATYGNSCYYKIIELTSQ